MQYRRWLLAGLFVQAGLAQAMGLGEMDMKSHLGAPLQAELNLFSPGEYDRQDIKVRIARMDVYDRMGAQHLPFHNQIEFDVQQDASGGIQILARSRNRVTEPFLDIVVELSWPGGTTYRRYTVLVDPPEYALRWQQKTRQAAPLEHAALQLARQVAPVPRQPRPVNSAPPQQAARTDGEGYVVRSGDSLWKIARRLSGDGATSVHAVMQDLYAANPDAFIQGDRNRLKLGATLYLPAGRIMPDQQVAQVTASRPRASLTTPTTPASVAATQAARQPVRPLDLEETLNTARREQHTLVPDDRAAIQAEIARLQREKSELLAYQQQIKADIAGVLEQRIAATEALLQAQKHQRQLAQTGATPIPAVDGREATPAPEIASAREPVPVAVARPAIQPTGIIVGRVMREEPDVAPRSLSDVRLRDLMAEPPAAIPTELALGSQDLLAATPIGINRAIGSSGTSLWYLIAMVPLGILVVLMGMRSHRVQQIRRTDQVKDENLHDLVFGSYRDRSRSESPDQLKQALTQIREKADTHGKQRLQQQADEALEARDDLKQMVDLYLVYSQYQKALNVILTEITKRPSRADLRLYLMQVYAEMGDWTAFEEQEEVLRRLGQEQLLEQANQLRAMKHKY